MGFNCGIVGLPNVGKSTLFNALTSTAAAEAENYPFCTVEPNTGRVAVPDPRLDELVRLAGSARVLSTQLEFVDIAGLVRGASKGEGLGNQFLGHIREVDAIVHVLRCFAGGDVTHVEGDVNPLRDRDTVETELMLADLESLEKRAEAATKKARSGNKEAKDELDLMTGVLEVLREGKPARSFGGTSEELQALARLQLITSKPVLYVCNVDEDAAAAGNGFSARVADRATKENAGCVVISAAIEAEVAQLSDEAEREDFLATLGLEETGLTRIIHAGYALLDLITFFTATSKEARAWTVRQGTLAPAAASVIHTDFEKGFICAETISYADYVACGGEQGARDAGKMCQEGKEYVVADGDVILFRFNV